MLSMSPQSKKMPVFDLVREAMDFRYPLSSPPATGFLARPQHIESSFASPTQNRITFDTAPVPAQHKSSANLYRNAQTWLDHNMLLPTSSSPAQSLSDHSIMSAGPDQGIAQSPHTSRATGNSPNFYHSLQLSDHTLEPILSIDRSASPKDQSIWPTSVDEPSDGDMEEPDLSGLTELTESSLDARDCSQSVGVSTQPSTITLAEESWPSQLPESKKDRHPGDMFLVHSNPQALIRDFTYELETTNVATQQHPPPPRSELPSKNFEAHRASPEEEQIEHSQNHAFCRALRNVASGLSLKKQYYAFDQVHRMLSSERSSEEISLHGVETITCKARVTKELDASPRLSTGDLWAQVDEATGAQRHAAYRFNSQQLQDHESREENPDVDEPQSAAMEISPIEDSHIGMKVSARPALTPILELHKRSDFRAPGAFIHDNNGQCQHAAVLRIDSPPRPEHHDSSVPQNVQLQEGPHIHKLQSNETLAGRDNASDVSRDPTLRLSTLEASETCKDSSVLTLPLPIFPGRNRTSSIVSISSDDSLSYHPKWPSTTRATRVAHSSGICQSVERETPRQQFVRESTPAYEDRSESPSPVSHMSARITSEAESDGDIDMLDILNVPHVPFERQDSMPPPYSPARSNHGMPREYNLPSSSPTAIASPTRAAYRNVHRASTPVPSPYLETHDPRHSAHSQPTFIPAPPPIPTDPSPFKLTKRSARRKSAVQGKPSKIEKPRSTTIGTVKEQQQQQRARGRKVTQAIHRVIVQAGVLESEGDFSTKNNPNAGDGDLPGARRSKRLMGKILFQQL